MGKITKQRLLEIAGLYEQNEGDEERRKIFVLVGPPSVGKSTWIESTFEEPPYVINRDEIVDRVAQELGWSYDDMFVTPPPDAEKGEVDEKYGTVIAAPKWMSWTPVAFSKVLAANAEVQNQFTQHVAGAAESGRDVVVDMTNMTPGARKQALKAIGNGDFEKIAVVFEFEGAEDIIQSVAQKRAEAAKRMGKSKTIPPEAFERMFKAFIRPSKSEGFDQIVSVDNRELLKHLANEPLEETTMNDFSKKRLQELAGIAAQSDEERTETLQENMKMFGMASPAPMGNPFGSNSLTEQELTEAEPDAGEDRLQDAKNYVRNAMEALQTALDQGLDEDQEMAEEVEGHLSTAYNLLTGAE